MADEDRLELELDEQPGPGADQDDLAAVVDACVDWMKGTQWRRDEAVTLDGISWRPHLVADGKLVHILLSHELRRYVRKRLAAAREAGIRATVVITINLLHDFDVLRFLVEHEIDVVLIDLPKVLRGPDAALTAIAYELEVTEDERRELARIGWAQCLDGDADAATKGRRLEGLLAFLLSQIDGLEIKSTNVRTETEELDIVVRQRSLAGRSWRLPNAPFIIVEAKNWHSKKAGQSEFSAFYLKTQGKRRTVRVALFVCTLGFTDKAEMQEIRGSRDEITVVLLGPDEISEWVNADSGDDCFEELVEEAMLR